MRFLLDQNLPASLIPLLADFGHEGLHAKSIGMAEATDREIWARAVELAAVVVSKDSDFVAFAGQGAKLVRVRIGNRPNRDLHAIISRGWPDVVARLEDGEVLVELRG